MCCEVGSVLLTVLELSDILLAFQVEPGVLPLGIASEGHENFPPRNAITDPESSQQIQQLVSCCPVCGCKRGLCVLALPFQNKTSLVLGEGVHCFLVVFTHRIQAEVWGTEVFCRHNLQRLSLHWECFWETSPGIVLHLTWAGGGMYQTKMRGNHANRFCDVFSLVLSELGNRCD